MKNRKNTAILFINLGTPESLSIKAIRKYLSEFLMDARVLDLPFFFRLILLYFFILPFRPKKVYHKYQLIWDNIKNQSPLLLHTEAFLQKLKSKLSDYTIDYAMRYGKPSIQEKMDEMYQKGIQYLHIIPLYPQYATSTYGSVIAHICKINQTYWDPFILSFEPVFNDDRNFLRIWCHKIQSIEEYETYHILFSFHGIPERHLKKSDRFNICLKNSCCDQVPEYCYKAQCWDISKKIARELGITNFSVAFQSRLGRAKWIEPYLEENIKEILKKHNKILIVPLSFTSDCLETLEELKVSIVNQFCSENVKIQVIDSLNDHDAWVNYWYEKIKNII